MAEVWNGLVVEVYILYVRRVRCQALGVVDVTRLTQGFGNWYRCILL